MRVKKYQAVDMPEALRMIKAELGPDAVILSTRQIKRGKGAFGLLGRPILEVTAAADLETDPSSPRPEERRGGPVGVAAANPAADHSSFLTLQADLDSLREQITFLGRRPRTPTPDVVTEGLKSLTEKVDRLLEQTASFERIRLGPGLRRLRSHLDAIDLDPSLGARLVAFLQEKAEAGALAEGKEADAFRELVRRTVRVSGGILGEGCKPRVVALVGPTGVGKTTTVAKLAARHALQGGRRVGLVTVDTYRIAAVEQLKTYGKIIGVPTHVAVDAGGFHAAVQDLADRDLVLVDTAGQSPKDEENLSELCSLLPEDASVEVHLVLSVTTRARDLGEILRNYAPLRASRLLLTKLDETDCHGPLLGLPLVSRLPVSYVTTGQNVPDDIEEATPELLADCLVRGLEPSP